MSGDEKSPDRRMLSTTGKIRDTNGAFLACGKDYPSPESMKRSSLDLVACREFRNGVSEKNSANRSPGQSSFREVSVFPVKFLNFFLASALSSASKYQTVIAYLVA